MGGGGSSSSSSSSSNNLKSGGAEEVACAAREALRSVRNEGDRARLAESLDRIHACVADFMDDFKESAYKSSLEEPARFYFDAAGNGCWRDHVNVHGLNWYLSMVRGAFDANCPACPMDGENDAIGFADHWSGLSDGAWRVFAKPENFGKSFEGIRELRQDRQSFVANRGPATGDVRGNAARFAKGNSSALEARCRRGDPALLPYYGRFAYFFRAEFFPKRLFEVLNAEHKPEHAGFRRACDDIFPLFLESAPTMAMSSSGAEEKEEGEEEGLLEWLYDDMMIEIQLPRLLAFLAFLGIVKPNKVF